tara:strand:- start:2586 stop:3041 length:456 start_codon:yes stop_codon:yes gene_type:complete
LKFLLTLWPPVQKDWANIVEIVAQEFTVNNQWNYRYVGSDWTSFIITLYHLCYEEDEHHKYPNIPKMLPKAAYMEQFSVDISLIEITVEDPEFQIYKNGNPYGVAEIKDLKNKIRKLYEGRIPRFSVIHSFDTPVRNDLVVELFEQECERF